MIASAADKDAISPDRVGLSGRIRAVIETSLFERLIIGAIILNAITLGLETSKPVMASYSDLLHQIDNVLLAVFVAEIALRMLAYGARFWRDPWSLFDLTVVAVTLLPASGNLSILRAFRILRALRLISAIPSMRRVVASLLSAVPSMGTIILLLLIIVYVFSVLTTKLFGADFETQFGSIGASAYTFFQIMTLDGWSGEVVRPVMEKFPWAWIIFMPYIILTTFMVLNLFIGIVVDAMQQQHATEAKAEASGPDGNLAAVRREIAMLRADLQERGLIQTVSGAATPLAALPPAHNLPGKIKKRRGRRRS